VLAFVGDDAGRNGLAGEDVVAQRLRPDRYQLGSEPEADAGILDQHRRHVAGVDLPRRSRNAAAAHDHQTEEIAG
jgi:hypothetical protein